MKRVVYVCLVCIVGSISYGVIWTETFEDGVGRLNQTSGNGDSVFAWDSNKEAISGTFNRYHHDSYVCDTRYADLGSIYDVHTNTLGFSAVITPLSSTDDYYNSSAYLGFLGNDTAPVSRLCVRFSRGTRDGNMINITAKYDDGGLLWSDTSLQYSWGTSYFVNALLDGPNNEFSVSVYEGTNAEGLFLGTISAQLDPSKQLTVFGLGIANGESISAPKTYIADINEMSLTVPEPATLSLLALGGLLLRRKRKA